MIDMVQQADLEHQIQVDSAGTAGYHIGKKADSRMRDSASRRGLDLTSRSRKLVRADLDCFDWVIAMDRENLSDIRLLHDAPTARVKLLSEYLDDQWPADVPDPYYGGDQGFETVLDMLYAGCPLILDEIVDSLS